MPIGSIIGPAIGLVGSLIGGKKQARAETAAADKAAQTSRLGFDYLTGSPVGKQYLPTGATANQAQADLLGIGGDPTRAANAFQNYANSTGLQFQLQQGQNAITSSAAARGLLNSGATLKALTKYGQNLGSTTFNNYLSQLGGLSTQGLQAGQLIGGAGSQAGATGANAIAQGYGKAADTQGSSITKAFGQFAGAASAAFAPSSGGYGPIPDTPYITPRVR